MLKNTPALRFLLALGGKRIVVMQQEDALQLYSDSRPCRRICPEHIYHALNTK